jgi:tape measure domain-containing protein
VSVVANVAVNLDARGVTAQLAAIRQGSIGAADGFKNLQARAQAVKSIVEAQQGSFAKASTVQGVFAAKVKNTEFAIKAQIAALRDVQSKVQFNGALYQKAGQQIKQYEAVLRSANAETQRAAGKFNGLRTSLAGLSSAFGGIAAVLGVIQAGRFVFAKTAEVESQSRSLAILAGSAEKANQIIKQLQDLGAITPFTSTELIDSAKRLQAFGVEADKVVETTRRLADASGATGAELSGLVTAYGQVQAKGRLQGEELLQFQERGIALQEELRKMYGMTGEEFQKALSKGQVSAKAVEVALQNLTNTGGKYANGAIAQSDTLSGRLSTLQDNVDGVAREVGKVLTPALIGILQQLNTSLSQTPAFVEDIALAFQYAAGQLAPFLNGLSQMQWFFTNLTPPGWAMQIIGGASERGKSTIRNAASRQRQSQKNAVIGPAAPQMQGPAIPERLRQKPNNLPPPLMIPSATVGGGGGRAAGGGADKAANDAKRAAEEANRLAEQIREQTKAAESLKIQQQGSLAILRSSNDFEKAFVEFSVKRTEIQRRYSELTLASKSDEERKLLTEARALEFKQSSFELQKQIADLTKQATAPLDDIVSKLKDQVAFEREYGELIKNGTNPELAKQIIEINRAYEASAAALVPALAAAQAAVTRAEAEGASATEIQKYREELERIQAIQSGLPAKKTDAIGAATELAKPKTDQQNITEKIATLKKEITDLTSISNIAITSAEGIGNAFAQSFQGLIDGTMTAKEALGSFFKSVADMFLEMAAQIIAKQITMIILQTILKALGAVGGIQSAGSSAGSAAFGGSGPTFNPGAFSMPQLAGRAVGGPVTSQQPYMVGERGPELFVPGTGGSVVNNSDLRSAMNGGSGGGSGYPVLNMSFQSTSINGVEYVSREQLESAMAETRRNATRDGAKSGMTMTLDRIQNSSSTRRKVGI